MIPVLRIITSIVIFLLYNNIIIIRVVRIRYACPQGFEEELLFEAVGEAAMWMKEFSGLFV